MVDVFTGDDEDDGGRAEGDPLLGSVLAAMSAGRDDRTDGTLDRRQGALFEAVLQPREPRTEQLQQTAPELSEDEREEK